MTAIYVDPSEMAACPACRGTGQTYHPHACYYCNGSGLVPPIQVAFGFNINAQPDAA